MKAVPEYVISFAFSKIKLFDILLSKYSKLDLFTPKFSFILFINLILSSPHLNENDEV